MKARRSITLAVLLMMCTAISGHAYSPGDRVQCTGTNVNVRNTSCGSIGHVDSPTRGTVLAGSASCTWMRFIVVQYQLGYRDHRLHLRGFLDACANLNAIHQQRESKLGSGIEQSPDLYDSWEQLHGAIDRPGWVPRQQLQSDGQSDNADFR